MHRILVLGGSGLVGRAFIKELTAAEGFQVYSTYYSNPSSSSQSKEFKFNLENTEDIVNILNLAKPHSVVSCLRGDFELQLALHIRIAEYLRQNGGSLYFLSTTNVFDNDMSRPHNEEDTPNSCTDYGGYKTVCEKRISSILKEKAVILRLPQIWGKDSPRLKQLIDSLSHNERITVYPRLYINTNTDVMVAKQVRFIIENKLEGIFHLASEDIVNHKDFNIELISKLASKSASVIDKNYEEEGCFALSSKRNNVFPEELRITNSSVIEHLTG